MAAKLVAEEGILKGLVLSLEDGDEWVIGRDPDTCQLLIEDPLASRKHLICKVTSQGIVVENLSQTNPVQVNDEEVKNPRLLHNGDAVKIGSGMFRFYNDEEAVIKNPKTNVINGDRKNPEETEDDLPPEEDTTEDTIFEENNHNGKDALAEINFDLVDAGRWLLKVIGGPNNGAEFSMQAANSYVIGTDPNTCDIVFHDTSVSRQHARINIGADDSLTIEDLKSRNGTLVDGETLKAKKRLPPNTIVSMGTTTFIVYDREGEMQTIISPLLPSIVKVLQKEEVRKAEETSLPLRPIETPKPVVIEKKPEKSGNAIGAFIFIGIITALFVIVGLGTASLFKSEPVSISQQIDPNKAITDALAPFHSVKWSYNKATGKLLLVGHVLSASDKSQLLYNLQGMNFIKDIDHTGIVIDEYVWQENNMVISKNPTWKGINIFSPAPGKFILSGYLQTRKQAEQLNDWITANFPYLDLLEKKVVVEEDVISTVTAQLQNIGLKDIVVQMSNGEISLSGGIPPDKQQDFDALVAEFRQIPGVRAVRNFVTGLAPEQSMINLSDKYEVTGFSKHGSGSVNVVINGRILARGDILDGMTITSIKNNTIFLEKDGVKYRIDFSR